MARRSLRRLVLALGATTTFIACGARSSLPEDAALPCKEGTLEACGSDVGACKKGLARCHKGELGTCEGATGPTPELCNGIDDDCNGEIDETFGVGQACDGPDTDLCPDDVMTCSGCTKGPDNVETCNGVDDNCNGIVDADCTVGDCKPTLVVTGSLPSDPGCIDFPVMKGATGTIEFPCAGGPVSATLGGVSFTGTVTNGFVSLDGVAEVTGPDTCLWKTSHHIEGSLSQPTLSYSYGEEVVQVGPLPPCWTPCTESGDVKIKWTAMP